MDDILNKLNHLTWFSELGRERSEIAPELRSLVIGQHVAFYRTYEKDVILRRIFHTRQDVGETLVPE
ncbi:MAG: type II toxin-antitoxin system RelE/ParE family toxin [Thermomicrobiales bacterium]